MKNSTRHSRAVLLCLVVLATSSLGGLTTRAQVQQGDRYYFGQTGHYVNPLFYNYWQEHGGLKQQGYPISEEIQEVSDIDGKTYTVQYFERAVFEHHPENRPPYDVLLQLLGSMQYRSRYPAGAPNEQPNESEGSRPFYVTGKRVGGSFLLYWEQNGGLAQYGYPISNEIQEKSLTDGQTYTVQYFERSVMEWHPGSPPPDDVQLSLLGVFRYNDKRTDQPTFQAPKVLLAGIELKSNVVAAHRQIFYAKAEGKLEKLYRLDVDRGAETDLGVPPANVSTLVTDGETLAWIELNGRIPLSIRAYDLSTGNDFTILESGELTEHTGLALDRGVVYFVDRKQSHRGLFARNVATGEERLISEKGRTPVAREGVLLWTEESSPYGAAEQTIHMLKTDGTQGDTVIATYRYPHVTDYDVSGDYIVYTQAYINDGDLHIYNMKTRTEEAIRANLSYLSGPGLRIMGSHVVWNRSNSGYCVVHCGDGPIKYGIASYSLTTRATKDLTGLSETGAFVQDLISPDLLVYSSTAFRDYPNNKHAVYMASLNAIK